jgi:hypothetical protein
VVSTASETFAINVKGSLPNGAYRFTIWDGFPACADDGSGGLLLAYAKKVYSYTGTTEFATTAGGDGNEMSMDYESGWIDFSSIVDGAGQRIKVLKRLNAYINGGSEGAVQFKWTFDYSSSFSTATKYVPAASAQSLYGIAQYGIGKYGLDFEVNRLKQVATRAGAVVKIGLKISGVSVATAINRIDLFAKIGKEVV